MGEKHTISPILTAAVLSVLGFGLLFIFSTLGLGTRWLIVIIILVIGYSFFRIIVEKELFLLGMMVFLIPYAIGFVYIFVTKSDMIFAFDVILFFLYLNWFFEAHGSKFEPLYVDKLTIPALLMLIWSSLSVFIAVSQIASGFAVFMLFKAFLVYFYISNRVTNKEQLRVIVDFLLIGLFIQGTIGVFQKALGRPLGLVFLGEVQRRLWFKLARMSGTLGFPNQYAAYLVLLLPMAISLFIFTKEKVKKLWYALVTGAGLLGLLFSLSRSAWIGLICGVIVLFLLITKNQKINPQLFWIVVSVMGIILVIGIVFRGLINLRLESSQSEEYRWLMIKIAFPIILANPILGVGLFNYQFHSFPIFNFWQPVHNDYLRLAAETGLPGLFFFLWFVFLVFREANRASKMRDRYLSAVAFGIFGGYTAFLISIMFGPQYQHYRQKFLFWVLAGSAVALKRIRRTEILKSHRKSSNENSND